MIYRVYYHLLERLHKLYKIRKKGWFSVTCLISSEDAPKMPHRFQINYFILLFLILLPVGLFFGAFSLHKNSIAIPLQKNLENRQIILSLLKTLLQEREQLLQNIDSKQTEIANLTYGNDQWQNNQEPPSQLANILLIGSSANPSPSSIDDSQKKRNMNALGNAFDQFQETFHEARVIFKEKARSYLYTLYHRSLLDSAIPSGWALKNRSGIRTSGFGFRTDPLTFQQEFHYGTDFADAVGTPIIATADGIVFEATDRGEEGYGRYIKVRHGFGYITVYAHCQSLLVGRGDRVRRGQIIALLGATGRVTGPHLHYEVRLGLNQPIASDQFVLLR